MSYRVRETGVYLATDFSLREAFKGVISAKAPITQDLLDSIQVDVVFEGPQASGGTVYQYSQFAGLEQINGKWFTKYVLGPIFTDRTEDGVTITAAQQEAEYKARKDAEQAVNVRRQRDELLAKTDWTQARDVNLANNSAYVTYRQALRDVPTQAGFPWNVDWPEKP